MSSPAPLIQLEHVTRRWPAGGSSSGPALDDVSLTLQHGEVVSVTGPSGSGKTSLLRVMGALDRGYEGVVRLAGRDIATLSDDELSVWRAERIGFIFQSFQLLPHLTVLQNVLLPLAFGPRVSRAPGEARARLALDRVGLGARLQSAPGELSGGQQQRVAIARALTTSPALLLCDEPTGALDRRTGEEVLDLLLELQQQHDLTVVLVTHDPGVAARARRSIVMEDGRIVHDGAPTPAVERWPSDAAPGATPASGPALEAVEEGR